MKREYSSTFPQQTWDSFTHPKAPGWSSHLLAVAQAYTRTIGSAAVMVVYQGRQLCAWGDTA
ncbi:MAG TPA: hypothetical protein VGF67_23295, partial [Ktedonobacteraceae bacterium]